MPTNHVRIVMTGGPGGGKSTLIRALRTEGWLAGRWLEVPEAAPLVFRAGLRARERAAQRAAVRIQVALEDILASEAAEKPLAICHRGADPLAYWLLFGWDEAAFFTDVGFTRDELMGRYFGVIHLRTAAVGAEAHYRRWPDAHRPESPETAASLDRLLERVWRDHPRFVLIPNDGVDWRKRRPPPWQSSTAGWPPPAIGRERVRFRVVTFARPRNAQDDLGAEIAHLCKESVQNERLGTPWIRVDGPVPIGTHRCFNRVDPV